MRQAVNRSDHNSRTRELSRLFDYLIARLFMSNILAWFGGMSEQIGVDGAGVSSVGGVNGR